MGEEVNVVIDKLCEKIGVAADVLVPEMAKYYIAKDIMTIIISAVIVIASVIIGIKAWAYDAKLRAEDPYYDVYLHWLVPLTFGGIAFLILLITANELVGWIASPTAATVHGILHMLGD